MRRRTWLLLINGVVFLGLPSLLWAQGRVLTLAAGLTIAPYNIPEMDSGIELDIVREALKPAGYTVKPKFVPFARRNLELARHEVDGALTITTDSGIEASYSDVHLLCENVVVTLKANNLTVLRPEDLKDLSVAAFQEATVYLGKAFADMAAANKRYREIADQNLQINLLYGGRIDAIVLDRYIFSYLRERNQKVDTTQAVTLHPIFKATPFRVAFVEEKVRDAFNAGLAELRRSGRYEAIIRTYIQEP